MNLRRSMIDMAGLLFDLVAPVPKLSKCCDRCGYPVLPAQIFLLTRCGELLCSDCGRRKIVADLAAGAVH